MTTHTLLAAVATAVVLQTGTSMAQSPGALPWISTWTASPQPGWDASFVLPTGMPEALQDQTLRETVKISVGGSRLRVVLSNKYGTQPLVIGRAQVARSVGSDAIDPSSDRRLTFAGQASVTVPAGAQAVSDAVDLPVAALSELAVSTYLPQYSPVTTFHWGAQQHGELASGDLVSAEQLKPQSRLEGRAFLSGVWVEPMRSTRVVAALGDSITDGNGSTPGANRRWPDYLAKRMAVHDVGVVNAGISGAQVLSDRMGVSALARLDDDVLSQPGVKTLVFFMGINDIGWPGSTFAPHDAPMTAATLTRAYRQIVAQAKARGIRVVGATLLPFEAALNSTPIEGYYTRQKDQVRQAVNEWIRTSGVFDAVVDFDALLRDPTNPARMLPAYDSGDHLHPGDLGYEAMANALNVGNLFGE